MSITAVAIEAALEAVLLLAVFGGVACVPAKVRRAINHLFHKGGF